MRALSMSKRTGQPLEGISGYSAFVYSRCSSTTIGLAMALASTRSSAAVMTAVELLDSARLVTEARFERFSAAMEASEPVRRMADVFLHIRPYLP
jgi:hypothetical protein